MHRVLDELQLNFVNGFVIYQLISWLEVDVFDLKQMLEMECN